MEGLTTSLPELLQSTRTFDGVLLLQHEAVATIPSSSSTSYDDLKRNGVDESTEDERKKRRRLIENKVRVVLLLTRSYARFLDQISGEHDALHQLADLQLADFFVYLQDASPYPDNGYDSDYCSTSTASATVGTLKTSILTEVEIISPLLIDGRKRTPQELSEMQILGKILYSALSLDQAYPIDLSSVLLCRTIPNKPSNGSLMNPTKKERVTDDSVLARLIECKTLPVSICRLLSDLIDSGPAGKADSPIDNVNEVIQELEQMITHPTQLLHDSPRPCEQVLSKSHGHESPRGGAEEQMLSKSHLFGKVYYGRKVEIAAIIDVAAQMDQISREENPEKVVKGGGGDVNRLEIVYVSGLPGSGKSALIQTVRDRLSGSGWTAIKAKFERSSEHTSRAMLLSMFDEVVSNLIKGTEKNSSSQESIQRVATSLLGALGQAGVLSLAEALPSVELLFDDKCWSRVTNEKMDAGKMDRQLIYSLTKLLETVLEYDKYIIICDDLQWVDQTSMSFITEILTNIGNVEHIRRHCLFVGLYREDEVDGKHPLSTQMEDLEANKSINISRIKLPSLSKDDVIEMVMTEFHLPQRIVLELASVVHKKTAGHPMFVIELLNTLLRDSTISYNSEKRRHCWNRSDIDCLQTGESVAELIASNISSMTPKFQRMLHILSCFGIKTIAAVVKILDKFEAGISTAIATFIEQGIIDTDGHMIIFTHDLIQQAVYENMDLHQRKSLHLDIGKFMCRQSEKSLSSSMGTLQLQNGVSLIFQLECIACDQIAFAGPEKINDKRLSERFLSAGLQCSQRFNYRAASYYFVKGIEFLGEDCWSEDLQLCLELHNGALTSSHALGEFHNVNEYAKAIIKHAPFEESFLAQQFTLRLLTQSGQIDECLARGIELLRRLGIDIAEDPTGEVIMNSVVSANIMASQFTVEQILQLCETSLDESSIFISLIYDGIHGAMMANSSPFLPLITAEIVKYSLQYGISEVSTIAFATFASMKVTLECDYLAGQCWSRIVKEIIKKHDAINTQYRKKSFTHFSARLSCHWNIDIWFHCPIEISYQLMKIHQEAMKAGEVDFVLYAFAFAGRYKVMGGENLNVARKTVGDRLQLIDKLSPEKSFILKPYAILDNILVSKLSGKTEYIIDGCTSIDDVQSNAIFGRVEFNVNLYKMMIGFFFNPDDITEVENHSHSAGATPNAKIQELLHIYYIFYSGLIAFQVHHSLGGDSRLKEGSEAMSKMESWTTCSPIFENKWLLLKAEYLSSIHSDDNPHQYYEASIDAAKRQGYIHELAIAYQLLGNYHATHGRTDDAKSNYNAAYVSYTQWGANAVAEKLSVKHNLSDKSTTKHSRNWE